MSPTLDSIISTSLVGYSSSHDCQATAKVNSSREAGASDSTSAVVTTPNSSSALLT